MKKTVFAFSLVMMVCSLAFSQSKKEKKRLKEEKAQNEFVELKKTIESGKMKFQFDWAMTQKGRRVNLSGSGYSLAVDTTNMSGAANLPYFGAVQVPNLSGDGGVKFSGSITDYSVKYKEKKYKAYVKFSARAESNQETFTFGISITGNGSSNAGVTSAYRNRISYTGNMSGL